MNTNEMKNDDMVNMTEKEYRQIESGFVEPEPGTDHGWDTMDEDMKNCYRNGGHIPDPSLKTLSDLLKDKEAIEMVVTPILEVELDENEKYKIHRQAVKKDTKANDMIQDSINVFLSMLSVMPLWNLIFKKDLKFWTEIVRKARVFQGPSYFYYTREDFKRELKITEKEAQFKKESDKFLRDMFDYMSTISVSSVTEKECSKIRTMMYSYQKKFNKYNRNFSVALFTPGTVVETGLSENIRSYDFPSRLTVKEVIECEFDRFLIISEEQRPSLTNPGVTEHHSFDSAHVTEVIKHAPSRIKFGDYDKPDKGAHDYNVPYGYVSKKGHYQFNYGNQFIHRMVKEMDILTHFHDAVDYDKFTLFLLDLNIIKCSTDIRYEREYGSFDRPLIAKKKQLKAAIRQNINRFKKTVKYQRQMKDEDEKQREDEYYADLDRFDD